MPNASSSTFAIGARQFVVQDAFEITWCLRGVVGVVVHAEHDGEVLALGRRADDDLLGARLEVRGRLLAVGEQPVDSITISTPSSFHGSSAGSRSARTVSSSPSTVMPLPSTLDLAVG